MTTNANIADPLYKLAASLLKELDRRNEAWARAGEAEHRRWLACRADPSASPAERHEALREWWAAFEKGLDASQAVFLHNLKEVYAEYLNAGGTAGLWSEDVFSVVAEMQRAGSVGR